MDRWKVDFVAGLREGKPESYLSKSCAGLPLAAVQAMREDDPEFAAAWDAAKIKVSAIPQRILTPAALEALLWAQCDDDEVAAYFGLKVREFKKLIASDDQLQLIYETAPLGGKAALKRAQMEAAMDGNWQALQWAGKQHLGQSDKVDHKNAGGFEGSGTVTINNIILRTMTNEQLETIALQAQGLDETLVIDVVPPQADKIEPILIEESEE